MLDRIEGLRDVARKHRGLNLGCGTVKVPGFAPDLQCDIRSLPYPDNYVSWIEAHHVLEHFGRKEAKDTLGEWHRVLIPGGLLFVTVPDLPRCFQTVLQNMEYPELWQPLMTAIYGVQENQFDYHKYGYSLPVLLIEMAEAGFDAEGFDWPYRPTPTIGVLGRKNNGESLVTKT